MCYMAHLLHRYLLNCIPPFVTMLCCTQNTSHPRTHSRMLFCNVVNLCVKTVTFLVIALTHNLHFQTRRLLLCIYPTLPQQRLVTGESTFAMVCPVCLFFYSGH